MAPRPGISVGAAIDIGNNSVHLLVGLVGAGWLQPLRDTSELLGLGDDVDAHGQISAGKRREVVELLRSYSKMARRSQAERVALVGTDPLRRAANAGDLVREIAGATGLAVHVLTEFQEALLTYIGVTRGVNPDHPLIVVDIGGGSTEIGIWGPREGFAATSVGLGSARLTNAVIRRDPATEEELDELGRRAAEAAAGVAGLPAAPASVNDGSDAPLTAVFVGGTATNVARLGRLTRTALAHDRRALAQLSTRQITARFNVKPRRARQLAAGVAIIDALLERFGLDAAVVSDASLRDGAIIAAARYGDAWPSRLDRILVGETELA